MKTIILGVLALLIAAVLVVRFWSGDEDTWICQDGEWVAHGKPSSSKPEAACGAEKTKPEIKEEKKADNESEPMEQRVVAEGNNIKIYSPSPNSAIVSPVKIAGEAKGWYFEASFTVRLVDSDGRLLAMGLAEAKSDWMVDEYVPFELELIFYPNEAKSGEILFEKDNPSGLPENAGSFSLPVLFSN